MQNLSNWVKEMRALSYCLKYEKMVDEKYAGIDPWPKNRWMDALNDYREQEEIGNGR